MSVGHIIAVEWICILGAMFVAFVLHDFWLAPVPLYGGFWCSGYWFAKRKRKLNAKVGSVTFVDCTFEDVS